MTRTAPAALVLALTLAAGCHGGPPDPPTAAAWQALSADQRCAATEARAARCADELVVMDVDLLSKGAHGGSQDLDLKGLHDALDKDAHLNPNRLGDDEAAAIHRDHCASDAHYADTVYACWTTDSCDALTKCIYAKTPVP